MTLFDLGWHDAHAFAFGQLAARHPALKPARLSQETAINFKALLADGSEVGAILCGRLWHEASCDADLPAVGDWVTLEPGGPDGHHIIRHLLPRRGLFCRKMPGNATQAQVIAANIDIVVVVTDPGADFNLRRIERYLTLIQRAKAKPVILLNKIDLFDAQHLAIAHSELARVVPPHTAIYAVSALRREGVQLVESLLEPGTTLCIVGSSGVGKSTLINQLLGYDSQWTSEVNQVTGKGRHTTTARQLIPLPQGGLLIDNPGMREIQMWTDEHTLREAFADVSALAAHCRFANCSHLKDEGCAIVAAVASGRLDPERYQSFLRLEEEIANLQRRAKKRQMAVERWHKRNHRVKARNLADRIELEKDERGYFEAR